MAELQRNVGKVRLQKLTVFSQQSHVARVGAPHHVLHLGDLDGGQRAFLLHVEQRDAVGVAQQQRTRPGVEDLLAARHLDLLHNFILQVLNQQLQRKGTRCSAPVSRSSHTFTSGLTECIRSRTANRFLATQTAVRPEDLFPSGAEERQSLSFSTVQTRLVQRHRV